MAMPVPSSPSSATPLGLDSPTLPSAFPL
jgi:hypothetical protein